MSNSMVIVCIVMMTTYLAYITSYSVITVSVPTTATYQESGGGTGTVMVCATLSGVIEGIQTPISITLATSDSTPGTELNK